MEYDFKDNGARKKLLGDIKRVVIKIGTRLLMDVSGQTPEQRIEQLVHEIALLRQKGLEIILVSSGAIGAGMKVLGTQKRPRKMAALQAHAAVGQCHLMTLYEEACHKEGFHCSQILLTAADLHDRERQMTVTQCLNELYAHNILPVINENDSVCIDEIKVGDNDTLAALVANMCRADLTILLTTIDGLKERNMETGELGQRISIVREIAGAVVNMAKGTDGNQFSVGGMITKLRAAAMTTCSGEPLWIADGFDFKILQRLINGEDVGTLFLPAHKSRLHARQRFLAFFSEPQGELIVDDGAENAICNMGKSLLPSGVIALKGLFEAGATVKISNIARKELARGTVNFNTVNLSKICGATTANLEQLLGFKPVAAEAVHRNSMVLTLPGMW